MPKRIVIKDPSTGNTAEMEVEDSHLVRDIIEEAINFFKLERAPYWLKKGKDQLSPDRTVGDAGIREGDIVEIIPDPTGGVFNGKISK